MCRDRTLASTLLILSGIGLAAGGLVLCAPARAQNVYQYGYTCPPGDYYYPNYGCVPPGYYYPPPYYVYPDFGFDFFYGGGWGRRWGGYYGGGGYRGGGYRGGGGGYHGGGGHGGGGHGGGHR